MATKYSEKEIAALEKKMINPANVVLCPRCGKALGYRAIGNSCEVKCSTEGCITGTSRGL